MDNKQKSLLESIPKNLHPLNKTVFLQKKASSVGFDWPNKKSVLLKIKEEINELSKELALENDEKIFEELSDVLFSIINFARFLKIDIENLLEQANDKFIHRFKKMENEIIKQGLNLQKVSLDEMEKIWNSLSD